jgi:general nucleoside transport system ATP-binding protein
VIAQAVPSSVEGAVSGVHPHHAQPFALEARDISKRFGDLVALDRVQFEMRPGSVHALLGENGAGKSTLVKCIMGFYHADSGRVMVHGNPLALKSPREAQKHGIGMVYQHFTLVENMTVAENLVLARAKLPFRIDWKQEVAAIHAFMDTMPFRVQPERSVRQLAAGEKQKLEILKQLYLGNRILILDEPTSVLTPQEADDVLGMLRAMAERQEVSVAMITHKFREVMDFADEVTVLRKGQSVGGGKTSELTPVAMAELMVGSAPPKAGLEREANSRAKRVLELSGLCALDDLGLPVLRNIDLHVHAGEIVGVAGVSGNGQDELVQVLAGQRSKTSGQVRVAGSDYRPVRAQIRQRGVRLLPEAPLANACVAEMSVAENIGFRVFDRPPFTWLRWFVNKQQFRRRAEGAIKDYRIKAPTTQTPIGDLSGGNVQRAILARELEGDVQLLIAANPCFGLDFAAVSEIRSRLMAARNGGAAVLLVSADLEEIFALADRIVVMSSGQLTFEAPVGTVDVRDVGRHMAGHSLPPSH